MTLPTIPILKTEMPDRGVYKSFNEFKNNNPSIKDFEIKKGQYTDELLITENNQTYPLQNFWGYSDGKNLFIRSADNLFQLIKAGNTFNIKGIKSFSQKYNKTVGNELVSSYLIGIPMSAFVKNNYKAVTYRFSTQHAKRRIILKHMIWFNQLWILFLKIFYFRY